MDLRQGAFIRDPLRQPVFQGLTVIPVRGLLGPVPLAPCRRCLGAETTNFLFTLLDFYYFLALCLGDLSVGVIDR